MTKRIDLSTIERPFVNDYFLSRRDCAIRAAAYIDTDGSIGIYPYNVKGKLRAYDLRCYLVCIDARIPTWLKSIYGGSHRLGNGSKRIRHHWTLTTRGAYKFLEETYPFLLLKKEQADIALEWCRGYYTGINTAPIQERKEYSHPYYLRLVTAKAELGELNK